MKAKIRDTEIYFDVEGVGLKGEEDRMVERPVMFVAHGGPGGDHSSYKPSISPLVDRVQIVYWDHRGQGRSARGPQETYTLENNVEDLEALRQHLGLDKIVLLGTSYGGMVALSYAVRYPENLSHLIAVVTAANSRFLERAKEIVAERGTPEQQEVCEKLWAGSFEDEADLEDYYEKMGPMYSLTHDAEKAKKRAKRSIRSVPAINEGFGGFLRTYDVMDQLHKITCPTLVIAGKHDWICAPELSEEFAARIPQADLRIFEHSAHSVAADEPDLFLDTIRGFLAYNQNTRNRALERTQA
jgi:proline iminopeptidase